MTTHRRRLDQVLDDEFLAGVDGLDRDELRSRRLLAREVENELSYYRRLLHGRMDLLRFEQRRRRGEETRSLIEALPQILADRDRPSATHGRLAMTDLPPLPDEGRRPIDQVLGADVLGRLDELDDDRLEAVIGELGQLEEEISSQRRTVQAVVDRLAGLLADGEEPAPHGS